MRRVLIIVAILVVAGIAVAVASGSGEPKYEVRGIFDSAANLIPGEEVKVAGVKIGKVTDVDVSAEQKAIVVMQIDDPGFQDFRADAHCLIRPQSLIGEKFVDCQPTRPHGPDEQAAAPLSKIPDGRPGAGQRLLPITNTSSPVDPDLIADILRLPYRERLSLIINELGTGVAGNARSLREVVRRAAPALQETDRVVKLLASQDQVLARLASDSDKVITPLAAKRAEVADFIVKANTTAQATAERGAALSASIAKLPAFLRALEPTMATLGRFATAATPVVADLGEAAPQLNRLTISTAPFMRAATPAVVELGKAAEPGIPAFKALTPIAKDLQSLGTTIRPLGRDLRQITESLRDTGGIERILDYAFFQSAAINGFDSIGHYLRAGLIVNLCSTYATAPAIGCSANFVKSGTRSASSASGPRDQLLARTRAVLEGADPADVLRRAAGRGKAAADAAIGLPSQIVPRREQAPARAQKQGSDTAAQGDPLRGLLDYLFGGAE